MTDSKLPRPEAEPGKPLPPGIRGPDVPPGRWGEYCMVKRQCRNCGRPTDGKRQFCGKCAGGERSSLF